MKMKLKNQKNEIKNNYIIKRIYIHFRKYLESSDVKKYFYTAGGLLRLATIQFRKILPQYIFSKVFYRI